MYEEWEYTAGEPQICSFFACGVELTLQESRLGSRCIHHSGASKELVGQGTPTAEDLLVNPLLYNVQVLSRNEDGGTLAVIKKRRL